jgi:hypothetical protein
MLFIKRSGSTFSRPSLGHPLLFGNTKIPDWPLEPIELVDGVPFLITQGYFCEGRSSSPEYYLDYCIQNCDWNSFRFKPRKGTEKEKALDRLLASKKWRSPLSQYERDFFSDQIK